MRRISFIFIPVFVIAISQGVVEGSDDSSDGDYDYGHILPEYDSIILPAYEDKQLPKPQATGRSNGECFCTYDYDNSYVRARVGYRLLKAGDRILQGETVSFECRYVSTVLTWKNGLRFFGRANMTCSRCERWHMSILPTCKLALETESVLGHEEDLAVLPDGTVELQKGESYQFFCSNVWKQPEWIYGERDGISVRQTNHRGDIYVSYLDISNAKGDHSGIYECFSRRPDGRQTLSTVLHIKVVEKSEKNGTSLATFPRNGVSPSGNTTPKPLENPNVKNNRECVCVYNPDNKAIARVGDKTLNGGDSILPGETVSIECKSRKYTKYALSWENSLLYRGKARISCSRCEEWSDRDQPTCRLFSIIRDVFLSSEEDLTFLPGGILYMRKGESRTISCNSGVYPSRWKYQTKENVTEWKSYTEYHQSHLKIKDAKYAHKGIYECISEGNKSVSLQLEVEDSESCPRHLLTSGLQVNYSDNLSVGSIARFRCSPSSGRMNGRPISICQPDGTWDNATPKCEDSDNCPRHLLTPGLQVYYSDDLSVGSIARFRCSISSGRMSGRRISRCKSDGTWDSVPPKCRDSKSCARHLLTSGLQVDYSHDLSVGSIARFSCSPSSGRMNGRPISICQPDGTWDNATPKCEDSESCPRHLLTSGLQVDYSDDLSFGSIARFSCSPSSGRMNGRPISICHPDGTWDNATPKCEDSESCPRHLLTSGLQVDYSHDLSFGSIARFSCSPSSGRMNGRPISICLPDGTWDNAIPKCEDDSKCSVENLLASLPKHMVLNMPNGMKEFTPGSEVQVKCENSVIDGKSKVMCGEHGQWKLGTLRCVPGCLLDLDPSSKLLVDPVKDSYRFGEFISLTCPSSYLLSSPVERLICLSGKWSDTFPECIHFEESHKF